MTNTISVCSLISIPEKYATSRLILRPSRVVAHMNRKIPRHGQGKRHRNGHDQNVSRQSHDELVRESNDRICSRDSKGQLDQEIYSHISSTGNSS